MKKITVIILSVLMLMPVLAFAASNDFDPEMPFSDAKSGAWYYSSVKYCAKNDLLKGMTPDCFGIKTTVSRAMFVQALANMEGVTAEDLRVEATPFTDIKPGNWYYTAVEWARQNGIVGGMTATSFAPNGDLTRSQMARLFCQYAKYKGMETDITADLSVFADEGKIQSWAKEGMSYCVALELFVGDKGNLNPNAKATREQLAVVMHKFDYRVKYNSTIPNSAEADALMVKADTSDRIVCWGDSLTVAANLDSYPEQLQQRYGIRCANYGVGGETAQAIAMRQGAIPFYVEPFSIPESGSVAIEIVDDRGKGTAIGVFGIEGVNAATIAGVKGNIAYIDDVLTFTRIGRGEAVEVTERTRVITMAMQNRRENDIIIIWSGSNNGYSSSGVQELIDIQEDMIAYSGSEKYIIIGLTSLDYMSDIDGVNRIMKEYWGDRYVDLREYMVTEQCLIDHGITPTETDIADIARGEIPASLRQDTIHGNQIFYDIVADMVAEKIDELGYLS